MIMIAIDLMRKNKWDMTASVSVALNAQRSHTERDCFQTVRGPNLSYAALCPK